VTTYLEWAGLNTMLTKYYNDAYISAVQGADPHHGRWARHSIIIDKSQGLLSLHMLTSITREHCTTPKHMRGLIWLPLLESY
jgi:hypothetical protein